MKKGRRRFVVGIVMAVLTMMTVMKVFRSVTMTKPRYGDDVDDHNADRQAQLELFAILPVSNHHHHVETTRKSRDAQEMIADFSRTNHQTLPTRIIHNSTTTTRTTTTTASSSPASSVSSSSSLCFALNTPAWLNGRRHENAHDPATDSDDEQRYQRHARVHGQLLRLSHGHLLEDAHSILNQSICLDSSRFLQFAAPEHEQEEHDYWVARLVYLAIYHHQHAPALAEARHYVEVFQQQEHRDDDDDASFPQRNTCLQARYSRQNGSNDAANTSNSKNLGAHDYECPETKYLGVTLWDQGIGANVQGIAVPALLAGLATNRTVVFINNARKEAARSWVMMKPWSLASCRTPRRDYQCFFAPLSPCVPTDQELRDAVQLSKTQKIHLFQEGSLPHEYQHEKFVYMLGLQKFPNASLGGDKVQNAVHRIAHHLIDQHEFQSAQGNKSVNNKEHDVHFMSLLRRAADRILHQEIDGDGKSNDDSVGNAPAATTTTTPSNTSSSAASTTSMPSPRFHFRFANSRIFHALALYVLRPNDSNQQKLQTMLKDTLDHHLASQQDQQQQRQRADIQIASVGLPVRASDKCIKESECLSLEQYMWAAQKAWHTFGPNGTTTLSSPPTIIFTTESTDMQEAQRRFVAAQKQRQQEAAKNVTTFAVVDSHHYQDSRTSAAAWTMMTNDVDVTPDSGRFKSQVANEKNVTGEEAMLSAISTLRLQLLARVTVGNCCSNFHVLLRNFLMEGCGATRDHYFHCLQDDDDPELRMCCFKSKSCIAQREKEIQQRQEQEHTK